MESNKNLSPERFKIGYDFFGISNAADVRAIRWKSKTCFRCFLHASGEEVDICRRNESGSVLWIDLRKEIPTPLSQILGQAIENSLPKNYLDNLD
jgi:hypothetical protein